MFAIFLQSNQLMYQNYNGGTGYETGVICTDSFTTQWTHITLQFSGTSITCWINSNPVLFKITNPSLAPSFGNLPNNLNQSNRILLGSEYLNITTTININAFTGVLRSLKIFN